MDRVTGLRLSLLISMGFIPAACGGTTGGGPEDENARGGSRNVSGGTKATGGSSATGGRSASGASNGGGLSVGGAAGFACTSPTTDPISGLVLCAEGYTHRPTAVACDIVGGAPADDGAGGVGGERPQVPAERPRADGSVPCNEDPSVCNAFEFGYCGVDEQLSVCLSGCMLDADCGRGYVCVCSGYTEHGGECQPADCTTDADCQTGSLCASFQQLCGANGFACQSSQDECASSEDCGGATCAWDYGTKARMCSDAVCGRPFLVEGQARLAPTVPTAAWATLEGAAPRLAHLTWSERSALAEHWTRMGQMEHASIAAFARFSLQLLTLGAPPELVEACTQALADETAHTKLCFSIASAYAAQAIGPGPLDIDRSLEVTSLADIVDLVIAEGCFGETSAALEALNAADAETDPVIRAAYARIGVDEQRHAALAFRFVRWALERGGEGVRARIATAIATPATRDIAALSVARPCLQALLALPYGLPSQVELKYVKAHA